MNESRKLKQWLNELEKELDKYISEDEATEVIDYYEEMVNDKLDDGEDIDKILNQYEPKKIAKQMVPKVLSKRTGKEKTMSKNAWLILLVLFSSPILLPLGIVYVSLMIVAISFIFSGFVIIASAFVTIIAYTVKVITLGLALPELLVSFGIGFITFGGLLALGYIFVKFSWIILQQLAIWFSKLIVRKRGQDETI